MLWRVGILYRSVDLLSVLAQQPATRAELVGSFGSQKFRGVNIADVLETCLQGGWACVAVDKEVCCTEQGCHVLSLESPRERLRSQIQTLLAKEDPLWAASAVQGRQAFANYAPPEAVQCFREAGLLDNEDEDVVAWWDALASRFRASQDEARLAVGRKGERLSFESERRRTGATPKWVALEYSGAGYDLVSCIDAENSTPLAIEVKASEQPWDRADFFLTRHEWDVLSKERHAVLHLWSISAGPVLHSSVETARLYEHIPFDRGRGQWHVCTIPFAAFSPK